MKKITVVVQKLSVILELIFVAGLVLSLGQLNCQAQDEVGTTPDSTQDATPQQSEDAPPQQEFNSMANTPQQQVNSAESAATQQVDIEPEDFPPEPKPPDESDDDGEPAWDLGTGLPLNILLTPLHWGNLSLLSFTTYEGYNSNPEYARIPVSNYLTSMSGLVLYSSRFDGWEMNAQYMPFVWISSRSTIKSFSAVSADLRTLRRINGNWRWTFVDRFRYSPTHSTEQQPGIVGNASGGFSVGNAFLSSGRNVLVNGASTTLADHYSDNSSLAFHATQLVTRLSSYITTQSSDNLPTEDAIAFSSGVAWHHHYGSSSTVNLDYNYRVQTSSAVTAAGFHTQSAGIGWSHKFTRTLGLSASTGPAWSSYSRNQISSRPTSGRITLHGSLAVSKQFRRGAAILSFGRNNGFSGVISDSFQNRYDFTVFRQMNTRLHFSTSASYVQQQLLNARSAKGELISGEARYSLTRDWSFFGQARYLKVDGGQRTVAPETNVIFGFRWAWSPEKP